MKKLTLLSLALSLSTGIFAQDAKTPVNATSSNGSFIGIIGGYSMPSGNWTKTSYISDEYGAWLANNPDNQSAGFAGNGTTFGIQGAWFFSNYIGIGGLVSCT